MTYRDGSTSMTLILILLSEPNALSDHTCFPHWLFYFLFVLGNVKRIDKILDDFGDSLSLISILV